MTADDFGLAPEVNEAVETAHRDGILTAASLMVGGAAIQDAVERARRLPDLRVGLHLVLVEGRPVLPPDAVPDLVGPGGDFRRDMVRMSFEMAARPRVRRQVEAEIAAQFEAFARTGLPLDHVNAHKHFHLHPLIGGIVLKVGRRFGMRAIRAPVEPKPVLRQVESQGAVGGRLEAMMARRLRRRARASGLVVTDAVFGLAFTGAMTAGRVAGLLKRCPPGLVELYVHPATADDFPGHAAGYRYRDELAALCDPQVLLAAEGRTRGGFSDWVGTTGR